MCSTIQPNTYINDTRRSTWNSNKLELAFQRFRGSNVFKWIKAKELSSIKIIKARRKDLNFGATITEEAASNQMKEWRERRLSQEHRKF